MVAVIHAVYFDHCLHKDLRSFSKLSHGDENHDALRQEFCWFSAVHLMTCYVLHSRWRTRDRSGCTAVEGVSTVKYFHPRCDNWRKISEWSKTVWV